MSIKMQRPQKAADWTIGARYKKEAGRLWSLSLVSARRVQLFMKGYDRLCAIKFSLNGDVLYLKRLCKRDFEDVMAKKFLMKRKFNRKEVLNIFFS